MTSASAGSPTGQDPERGLIAEGDNIAVGAADAPNPVDLRLAYARIREALAKAAYEAALSEDGKLIGLPWDATDAGKASWLRVADACLSLTKADHIIGLSVTGDKTSGPSETAEQCAKIADYQAELAQDNLNENYDVAFNRPASQIAKRIAFSIRALSTPSDGWLDDRDATLEEAACEVCCGRGKVAAERTGLSLPGRDAGEAVARTHALARWIMGNRDNQDMSHRDFRIEVGKLVEAGEMAAFGASDAACYLYPGEDQQAERAAYCQGAHDAVLTLSLPISGDAEARARELLADEYRKDSPQSAMAVLAGMGGFDRALAAIRVALSTPSDGWLDDRDATLEEAACEVDFLTRVAAASPFWPNGCADEIAKVGERIRSRKSDPSTPEPGK